MASNKRGESGEGDRESARRYNKHTREFVESETRAGRDFRNRDAKGRNTQGADDDFDDDEWSADGRPDEAERSARKRAREFDPQVKRDYRKPTTDHLG